MFIAPGINKAGHLFLLLTSAGMPDSTTSVTFFSCVLGAMAGMSASCVAADAGSSSSLIVASPCTVPSVDYRRCYRAAPRLISRFSQRRENYRNRSFFGLIFDEKFQKNWRTNSFISVTDKSDYWNFENVKIALSDL